MVLDEQQESAGIIGAYDIALAIGHGQFHGVEAGDIEEAEDIFYEIDEERIKFLNNLPQWYKIRWRMIPSDEETYNKAVKIYEQNIYRRK